MIFSSSFNDGRRFLSTYLRGRNNCTYRPLMVFVEPTNICNISCVMCPQARMVRERGYMPLAIYKKLIENNYRFIQNLNLYLIGEPLLHPEIIEMIDYAVQFKIWTNIFTNATLIDKKLAEALVRSGLNVLTISFEGVEKRYEGIRKGASFKQVMENIRQLMAIKRANKGGWPNIVVKFLNFNFSATELREFRSKIKAAGVNYLWAVPRHDWPSLKSQLWEGANNGKYYPCVLPWSTLTVTWDGVVLGCCDDFNAGSPVGNIKETIDLSKIWNGPRMLSLRKRLANREYNMLGLCRNCTRIRKSPFIYPIFKNAVWNAYEHILGG